MKRFLILAGALLFAGSALAADVDVDLTAPLRDLDGAAIPSSPLKDAPPMTIGRAIEQALTLYTPPAGTDPAAAMSEKVATFAFALRIHTATKMSFVSEEITKIKLAVSQVYPNPIVLGRIVEVIDPKVLKPDAAK